MCEIRDIAPISDKTLPRFEYLDLRQFSSAQSQAKAAREIVYSLGF